MNRNPSRLLPTLVKSISTLSLVVAIWNLIHPSPNENYAIAIGILISLISIILLKVYNGKLFIFKTGVNNTDRLIYSFLFLSVVLTVNSFYYYYYFVLDYRYVWIYGSILAFVLLFIILFKTKEFTIKSILDLIKITAFSVLIAGYSCSVIIYLNCKLNNQSYVYYQTEILNKEIIKSDKVPFYHLYLAPWEKKNEISDLEVSNNFYYKSRVGQLIKIKYYDGKLGVPWYEIDYEK